jgi:hypothetical protein
VCPGLLYHGNIRRWSLSRPVQFAGSYADAAECSLPGLAPASPEHRRTMQITLRSGNIAQVGFLKLSMNCFSMGRGLTRRNRTWLPLAQKTRLLNSLPVFTATLCRRADRSSVCVLSSQSSKTRLPVPPGQWLIRPYASQSSRRPARLVTGFELSAIS